MTIAVQVDLTNPGQLLAACGLLEAADRRWRNEAWITGRFEGDRFLVEGAPGSLDGIVSWLTTANVKGVLRSEKKVRGAQPHVDYVYEGSGDDAAVLAFPDGTNWILNSWSGEDFGRTRLKTFAGQMKGPKIVAHVLEYVRRLPAPLDETGLNLTLGDGEAAVFGFGARKGQAALDVGFSTDALNIGGTDFPITELFATLALQSFRPASDNNDLLLGVWLQPLPVELARAAAACAYGLPGLRRYRFRLLGRKARSGVEGAPNDQYKSFTSASLEPELEEHSDA